MPHRGTSRRATRTQASKDVPPPGDLCSTLGQTAIDAALRFGFAWPEGIRATEPMAVFERSLVRLRDAGVRNPSGQEWELLLLRREFLKTLASEFRIQDLRRAMAELGEEQLDPLCEQLASMMEFDAGSAGKNASAFDPLLLPVAAAEGEDDNLRHARLALVVAFMKAQEDGFRASKAQLDRVAKQIANEVRAARAEAARARPAACARRADTEGRD
jgi:hypothetical protein